MQINLQLRLGFRVEKFPINRGLYFTRQGGSFSFHIGNYLINFLCESDPEDEEEFDFDSLAQALK